MTFTKHDSDKPRLSKLPVEGLAGVAKVMEFGAKKYGWDNWKQATSEDVERYVDAGLRHWFAHANGELLDPESGLPHIHHAACNAMFVSWFLSQETSNEIQSNDSRKPTTHILGTSQRIQR